MDFTLKKLNDDFYLDMGFLFYGHRYIASM